MKRLIVLGVAMLFLATIAVPAFAGPKVMLIRNGHYISVDAQAVPHQLAHGARIPGKGHGGGGGGSK